LVKFNANGTRVWSTYYGGRKADIINQVKVSNSQNVYVVGRHSVTITFLQIVCFDSLWDEGKTGRFFVKFDANGERIWGSYYGVALVTYLLILQKKFYISGETFADKKISTQMLIK
jgi:hypothetical protein